MRVSAWCTAAALAAAWLNSSSSRNFAVRVNEDQRLTIDTSVVDRSFAAVLSRDPSAAAHSNNSSSSINFPRADIAVDRGDIESRTAAITASFAAI
jgi:hypothetical protein